MPSYCYLKSLFDMSVSKVSREKDLNDCQVLLKFENGEYIVARKTDILSVEQYTDIREKELKKFKEELVKLMRKRDIEISDVYDTLQRIDNETNI